MAADPNTNDLKEAWKLLTRVLTYLVASPEDAKDAVKKSFDDIKRFCNKKNHSVEHVFRCMEAVAREVLKEDGRRAARQQLATSNNATQFSLAARLGLDSSSEESEPELDHTESYNRSSAVAATATKKKHTTHEQDPANMDTTVLLELLLKRPEFQQTFAAALASNQGLAATAAHALTINHGPPSPIAPRVQTRNSINAPDGTKKRQTSAITQPSTSNATPRFCGDCSALLPPGVMDVCTECREKTGAKCLDCGGEVSRKATRCRQCFLKFAKKSAQQRKRSGKKRSAKKRPPSAAAKRHANNDAAGENVPPKKRLTKVDKNRVCKSCKGPISRDAKSLCRECHIKQSKKSRQNSKPAPAEMDHANVNSPHINNPDHVDHASLSLFDSAMNIIGGDLSGADQQQQLLKTENDRW